MAKNVCFAKAFSFHACRKLPEFEMNNKIQLRISIHDKKNTNFIQYGFLEELTKSSAARILSIKLNIVNKNIIIKIHICQYFLNKHFLEILNINFLTLILMRKHGKSLKETT